MSEDLIELLADEKFMGRLLYLKFWKQSEELNTIPECREAAALAADLIRAIVTEPEYLTELVKRRAEEQA